MVRLKLYALIVFGVFLGLMGLRFHWMRIAEERIEAEAARASNQRMREANEIKDQIDSLGRDDLRDRASRWVRGASDQ